ncbi:MAG: serine hydrolase domain-containing protein [Clostridia bacterium]
MPIGAPKNLLYALAMPVIGMRCAWKQVHGGDPATAAALRRIFKRRHVVGACVQTFQHGEPTACYTVGNARMEPQPLSVDENTLFRTASIAKMANALLVFRMQTLGKLSIYEDVSDFLGYRVQNPYCPDAPITLGMLLGHTSSIVDSPAYFEAFSQPCALSELLKRHSSFMGAIPGVTFRYSNLAAGMIGCMLEKRFGESYESLAQRELFAPLHVNATFDLSTLGERPLADCFRVLPAARAFDAQARCESAAPLDQPDPEHHYLLASGGLFLTATALASLAAVAWSGGDGFLNAQSLDQMQKPVTQWPEERVKLRHGMGLLQVDDHNICSRPLWGHQGFAYGAVNGVFFDAQGDGFALLNSGASEQRVGHLAVINRDLISLLCK